jgi:electron transfer flavoprotein beta subunit
MRICVCLRQVPDPRGRLELRADGSGLRDDELPWVTDEGDECALEEALRLVAAAGSGEVTALSLGPERAAETLRRALALGASRALHVSGTAPADPRRTARLLAAAIERSGTYDLVFTGAQSSDLGRGVTGTLVAAELGWAHVWLVVATALEPAGGDGVQLRVTRELEGRRREISRVGLPAVLCVQTGLHPPRMPRIRDLLEAKKRPIEELAADALVAAGAPGSSAALELVSLSAPPGGEATRIPGTPAVAARELVHLLRRDGLLAVGR